MGSISGGELIARMLQAEGVEVAFGIIDGSYAGVYTNLHKYGIRLISPRHEATAAHMAGAYARLTGKLGVCIASNGPGAANVIGGIAVENGEGNRVLCLTSWRRSPIVGPDRGGTYQYFDQVAVAKAMSKWSGAARTFDRIPEVMRRAFRVAWQGRPGVVHVSVPEDVLNTPVDADPPVLRPARYRRTAPLRPAVEDVQQAARMLAEAEQPLIHVGSGVLHAGASERVAELARVLTAPVSASWGARAVLDAREKFSMPMMPPLIDEVRNSADVVLAVGTRFGETDWWGKPPYWRKPDEQRLIQVDVDDEILGLNKPVELAVLADADAFLEALLAELKQHDLAARTPGRAERLETWAGTASGMRRFLAGAAADPEADPMHTAFVPLVCREVFEDDAVLVIDGGNTAVWTNLLHENREPGAQLSTFKFGMLGAGLGQALGAQIAHPERQVYCIMGDGAMGFHLQEVETAVRHRLPIVFLVICDKQWGMVKFNQSMALDPDTMTAQRSLPPGKNINADFEEIRFHEVAQAMGAHGERVSRGCDLKPALERCLASRKPAVVHVDVDPVAHMWAPGLDVFKAMHLEPGE